MTETVEVASPRVQSAEVKGGTVVALKVLEGTLDEKSAAAIVATTTMMTKIAMIQISVLRCIVGQYTRFEGPKTSSRFVLLQCPDG